MKGVILTYVLTYGGAAASFIRPFVGLLIYVGFAVLKPQGVWGWTLGDGNYDRIVALALLVGWALHGFGNWSFGRARGIVMVLVAYWSWALIGAFMAPDQELAFRFVENLFKTVLPFVVGMTLFRDVRELKLLAWAIVISQGYVAYEMNMSYLGGFNELKDAGYAGMDNNSVAIAMVTAVGVGFFLGLHSPRWWQKLTAFGFTALLVHAILFSFSRGAMVALVITGAVAFCIMPKKPKHYLVLALGVALALRLAGPEVQKRFSTSLADYEERDESAQSRLELWAVCFDAMCKRPIFGIGPDNFPGIVHEYGWPEGKEAHTLWLQIGAELGFPGLGFLLLFYVLTIWRLWPLTRERRWVPDPWIRPLARMVVSGLIGFAVAAQFVSLEGLELPYYVALVGAGVLKLCSVSPPANGYVAPPASARIPLTPSSPVRYATS